VEGNHIVQFDRRNNVIIDEAAVREKFGVGPESIADYLGLVGDSADGFPGLQGWGAKSASTVLAKYGTIDNIPDSHDQWVSDGVTVRGAEKLATTLRANRTDAQLFKTLATLVQDVEVGEISDWKWNGPTDRFVAVAEKLIKSSLVAKTCIKAGVWIFTKNNLLQICDTELKIVLAIPACTGKKATPTYPWLFKAQRFKPGYSSSQSGQKLYYSVFFYKGLAIAGVEAVSSKPCSNGSVFIEKKHAKQVYEHIAENKSLIWVKS
jgi:hypothetical protein